MARKDANDGVLVALAAGTWNEGDVRVTPRWMEGARRTVLTCGGVGEGEGNKAP